MIMDGERLKALLGGAQRNALLCSPFIKAKVLEVLLSIINEDVFVRIVTRWRASEVASGVSDLEIFEIVNNRPKTELSLLNNLHAKIYLADEEGVAGSANLTATALGWADNSNVELLLPVIRSQPDVKRLLHRLEMAQPATAAIRSDVQAEADALSAIQLDEGRDMPEEMVDIRKRAWLPQCAAPGQLWKIYKNRKTMAVVTSTKEEGLVDLGDLNIPTSLSRLDFNEAVRSALRQMPAFNRILERIPQGIKDSDGIGLISAIEPSLSPSYVSLQWRIVRDWISEFFGKEFEVAPDSFITRLKQR